MQQIITTPVGTFDVTNRISVFCNLVVLTTDAVTLGAIQDYPAQFDGRLAAYGLLLPVEAGEGVRKVHGSGFAWYKEDQEFAETPAEHALNALWAWYLPNRDARNRHGLGHTPMTTERCVLITHERTIAMGRSGPTCQAFKLTEWSDRCLTGLVWLEVWQIRAIVRGAKNIVGVPVKRTGDTICLGGQYGVALSTAELLRLHEYTEGVYADYMARYWVGKRDEDGFWMSKSEQ